MNRLYRPCKQINWLHCPCKQKNGLHCPCKQMDKLPVNRCSLWEIVRNRPWQSSSAHTCVCVCVCVCTWSVYVQCVHTHFTSEGIEGVHFSQLLKGFSFLTYNVKECLRLTATNTHTVYKYIYIHSIHSMSIYISYSHVPHILVFLYRKVRSLVRSPYDIK